MVQKERSARHCINRKENGLCPRCGKKLGREGHYCCECLEKVRIYHRENRDFYRENHICTECGKVKVFGNERTCPECRAKINNRRKPLTDEQKNKYNERFKKQQKLLYQQRKEQGICTKCGKRKVMEGRVKCKICLEKRCCGTQKSSYINHKESRRCQNGWNYFTDERLKSQLGNFFLVLKQKN